MKRRRRKPVPPIEPITGYLDPKSRMDYLRQKMAAEGRMRAHDAQDDAAVRDVFNAVGTASGLMYLWRRGIRTFEDAERALAADGEIRNRGE